VRGTRARHWRSKPLTPESRAPSCIVRLSPLRQRQRMNSTASVGRSVQGPVPRAYPHEIEIAGPGDTVAPSPRATRAKSDAPRNAFKPLEWRKSTL